MAEPRKRFRRRQILSNPREQLKIVATFVVLAVLYTATNYFVAKGTLWSLSSDILQLPLSAANQADVNVIVEQQSLTLDMQLGLFTLLVVAMLSLAGLLMSHRLAGPIYQLKTYLRLMAHGEVKPRHIRFRKQDFFNDLAERFNDFQQSQGILPPDDAPTSDTLNAPPKPDAGTK